MAPRARLQVEFDRREGRETPAYVLGLADGSLLCLDAPGVPPELPQRDPLTQRRATAAAAARLQVAIDKRLGRPTDPEVAGLADGSLVVTSLEPNGFRAREPVHPQGPPVHYTRADLGRSDVSDDKSGPEPAAATSEHADSSAFARR